MHSAKRRISTADFQFYPNESDFTGQKQRRSKRDSHDKTVVDKTNVATPLPTNWQKRQETQHEWTSSSQEKTLDQECMLPPAYHSSQNLPSLLPPTPAATPPPASTPSWQPATMNRLSSWKKPTETVPTTPTTLFHAMPTPANNQVQCSPAARGRSVPLSTRPPLPLVLPTTAESDANSSIPISMTESFHENQSDAHTNTADPNQSNSSPPQSQHPLHEFDTNQYHESLQNYESQFMQEQCNLHQQMQSFLHEQLFGRLQDSFTTNLFPQRRQQLEDLLNQIQDAQQEQDKLKSQLALLESSLKSTYQGLIRDLH